jgi:hypothetical protein
MNAMVRSRARAWCRLATLLGIAALGVMPSPASAVTFVQQKTNNASSASSLSVTFTTNVSTTAGNVLVMVGGNSTGALTGVSGGGVGTWTKATSSLTHNEVEIWYGAVDVATNTSTTPVTATASAAGGMYMSVTEWNGLSLTIDKTAAQGGTTSPASPPSITTTNASSNDLVLFGVADNSGNTYGTPSGGTWTALSPQITTPVAQSVWYQIAAAGTFSPTVTETAHSWDAVIAALKGCAAAVSDPTYVTANGQSAKAIIYWATPNQVMIARNTTNSFGTPATGTAYAVSAALPTAGTVMYNGAAGSFTQTTTDATNPITNNTTYYYKVFTNCDLTYSAGVVVTVKPSNSPSQLLWSYETTASTMVAPGIDDNNVVVWGGNDNRIHGADSGVGTPDISPFTMGGASQSRPVIIPAAYSATSPQVTVAYITGQDGYVYAINTATGTSIWSSSASCATGGQRSVTAAGSSCVPGSSSFPVQGGAAVWLKAFGGTTICGASTDVVFVTTRNTGTTGNVVYALNGGNTAVTSNGSGNCQGPSGTTVQPGDWLWKFVGASGSNPAMYYSSSTPYIDYNVSPPALWVTSRANTTTTIPSLWKFNLTNGTLYNGSTTCNTGGSVWCLGDIDTAPAQSGDGTWMYVTTAMSTPTLQAVQGSTIYSYTPGGGVLSAPVPIATGSFGTTTTIAAVSSAKGTSTASTTCQVSLGSVAAGNTIVVAALTSSVVTTVSSISDGTNHYTRRRNLGVTGGNSEIWVTTVAAGSPSTLTITVTVSASASNVCIASQYSGVGAVGAVTGASGTTTNSVKTATVALTTQAGDSNNWIVAAYVAVNSTSPTQLTGTLRQAAALAFPVSGALSDNIGASGGTSVTNAVTVATSSGVNWAVNAIELRARKVDAIALTNGGSQFLIQFAATPSNTFFLAGSCGCIAAGTPVYDGIGYLYFGGTANGTIYRFDAVGFNYDRTSIVIGASTATIGDPSYDGVLNRLYVGSTDGHVYGLTSGW